MLRPRQTDLLAACSFATVDALRKAYSSWHGWLSPLSLGDIPEVIFLLPFTLLAECIPVELLQPFTSPVPCVDKTAEEMIERILRMVVTATFFRTI